MGTVTHATPAVGTDSGDDRISKNAWDAAHTVPTDAIRKNNFSATTNPTVNDDTGDGYEIGSLWINTTINDATGVWIALDVSSGAAIWVNPSTGGGAAKLLVDSVALHANGDEGDDDQLSNFTLGGGLTTADVTAVTTEPYDPTCLDIVFAAQSDRMTVPVPGTTNYEAYLSLHGVTNDGADPLTALGGMMALVFVDDSGNGTGFSLYNDGLYYMWAITGWAYAGTGNGASTWLSPSLWLSGSNFPIVYKLSKSGSTITGGVSFNGGASFRTVTRTDSTTFTKAGIVRLFTSGGTNPKLRYGRLNLVEL